MTRKTKPGLETLERRDVPATFGVPWHDPGHLSLSFAPDGTAIGGQESDLFASLGRRQSTAVWQRTLLRAFQTWAEHANIDLGLEADGGQDFGAPGLAQLDPRFGDIRLGARRMGPDVLAVAVPPDPTLSGTLSGDVLLNSEVAFDGSPSLLAVAMHEAGHALGLGNSTDPNSVMYSLYNHARTDLSAGDIEAVQALYGVRARDPFEGPDGNSTRLKASPFPIPAAYAGETPLIAFGDVTTRSDVDFYVLEIPNDGNNDDVDDRSITIRLQTSGASLLAPKLTIQDARGRTLATRTTTSAGGDVLQVQLRGVRERAVFYVKVEAARRDVFGVGRYGLSARFDKTSSTPDPTIDALLRGPFDGLGPDAVDTFFRAGGDVLLNAEDGANDTVGSATPLLARPGYAASTRYEAIASLAKREDVDFYRVRSPSGGSSVLTITAWTTAQDGFRPEVAVFDAAGRRVAAEVLVNGNGTSTIQVADARPGRDYLVRVTVAGDAGQDKGNYLVAASFGSVRAPLSTFAQGTLSDRDRDDASRLYVARAHLFHFALTAGAEDPAASVVMTVRDASGRVVREIRARAGSTVTGGSVFLTPGPYTVRFEIDNPSGRRVSYVLKGNRESDPIGPVASDPTLTPQYTPPPPPGATTPPPHVYPPGPVSYDPATLPGFVIPGDPSTYPPGFVLPPELADQPWVLASPEPFYWLALGG